ncbi:MAG TPA: hypothetical protein VN370_05985 [Desulfitobacteriaceae bacterium]|nr:hypothetical protein [Desulfitobacteriaceae bacterium]
MILCKDSGLRQSGMSMIDVRKFPRGQRVIRFYDPGSAQQQV